MYALSVVVSVYFHLGSKKSKVFIVVVFYAARFYIHNDLPARVCDERSLVATFTHCNFYSRKKMISLSKFRENALY